MILNEFSLQKDYNQILNCLKNVLFCLIFNLQDECVKVENHIQLLENVSLLKSYKMKSEDGMEIVDVKKGKYKSKLEKNIHKYINYAK